MKKFVISRVCRLYPTFWISVIVMSGVLYISGTAPQFRQIAANLTMAYPLFKEPALSGVYWTLIIELAFYFGAAALFAMGMINKPWPVFVAGVLLVASGTAPILANWILSTTLPALFLGHFLSFLLLGLLIHQHALGIPNAKIAAITLAVVIWSSLPIVTGMLTGVSTNYSLAHPVGAILAITAALGIFLISWHDRFSAPGKVALGLGAWSYSVYLLHEPIAGIVRLIFVPDSAVKAVGFLGSVVIFTLICAKLIFEHVEVPAQRLGRWLSSRGKSEAIELPAS